jgi:hypothetical protein
MASKNETHPGQLAHKLMDAMEAVRSGDYKLVPGAGSRTKKFTNPGVEYAVRVKGIYIRTGFDKAHYDEAPDGWMHELMPWFLYDGLQIRFYDIVGAFPHGRRMSDKSDWVQCDTTRFCKVVMNGSLAEDVAQLAETFGSRASTSFRHFPYVRCSNGTVHSISLLTVNFAPGDAVLFKLTHIGA